MSFQLNPDLKVFNWNKSGGGGLDVTLTIFTCLMLMSETSVFMGPF